MWLLAQILIYLLLAFLIGGVGGWMLRGRRAQDAQLHLQERFKQMVSSIEMERDAARLKARDLSARLEALEGASSSLEGTTLAGGEGPETQKQRSTIRERPGETAPVWSAAPAEDRPEPSGGTAEEAPLEGPKAGLEPGEETPGPWEPTPHQAPDDRAEHGARDRLDHVPDVGSEPSVEPAAEDEPEAGQGLAGEDEPEPGDGAAGEEQPEPAADAADEETPEPVVEASGEDQTGPGVEAAGQEVPEPVVEAAGQDRPEPGVELAREADPVPELEAGEGGPGDDGPTDDGDPAPSARGGGTRWELVEEPTTPEAHEQAAVPESSADDHPKVDRRPLSHLGEVPPQASRKLRAMGIEDTSALHGHFVEGADPADLADSLGVEARRVRRWKTLAELLELPTVDAPHAWLLEIAGVASLTELAAEDPAELTQRMVHLNRDQGLGLPVPEAARVATWVEGAGQRQERG